MSLRPLIKKQKIRIDAHQRGNGHQDRWDATTDDIHIDKRTITNVNGKKVKATLRIPLNSDREVTCEVNKSPNVQASNRIIKEVKEAFRDESTREAFIMDLIGELENYQSSLSSQDKVEQAAMKIAKHFDLTQDMRSKISFRIKQHFTEVTIEFKEKNGEQYFVAVNEKEITAGELSRKGRT